VEVPDECLPFFCANWETRLLKLRKLHEEIEVIKLTKIMPLITLQLKTEAQNAIQII